MPPRGSLYNIPAVSVAFQSPIGPGAFEYPSALPTAVNFANVAGGVGWPAASLGCVFMAPKAGTITKIGVYTEGVGTPPSTYSIALVTMVATGNTTGNLTTTPITGAVEETYTYPGSGQWTWVTLSGGGVAVTRNQYFGARLWCTFVDAGSNLNEALDNSETGIDVVDGTKFSNGQTILIDNEQMVISSISSNTLTVSARGANGSTAVTHSNGATIYRFTTVPDSSNYLIGYRARLGGSGNLPRSCTTSVNLNGQANNNRSLMMAVQYSDGTTLGYPQIGVNYQANPDLPSSEAYGPTAAVDEIGNLFSNPYDVTVEGFRLSMTYGPIGPTNAGDITVKLYDADGTTVLGSITVSDWDVLGPSSNPELFDIYLSSPITLIKNISYRLTILANSGADTYRIGQYSLPDAASRSFLPDGLLWQRTSRLAGGTWTEDNTKVCHMALLQSAIFMQAN